MNPNATAFVSKSNLPDHPYEAPDGAYWEWTELLKAQAGNHGHIYYWALREVDDCK